ncbi:hypothetical protein ARMGADRAFT_1032958 [Armillaria gallica]|uniref:Uncharacterized protein n=1 Tax=Armillaria gallica TaxID=47427 RepID=A0A2H3DEK9_ARMGA|nr:hypothetical protein ARMGADRAFT_1032958 [Armillaria gallica]
MWAFEWVYQAEVGELGPESVYSAVLMPVLKVTSNGSIVSNWEACPNSRMADKWESDDEGEEEGLVAFVKQICHSMWWILVALGSGTGLLSLDPKEENLSGIGKEEDCGGLGLQGGPKTPGNMLCMIGQGNQNTQGWDASVFQKIKKQCVFQLAEWKTSMAECCKKRRVNYAQQGSSG